MNFREYLDKQVVLFDGAMGTQIQNLGLPLGVCPESFNINNRDELCKIHKSYIKAGSKVISANTFGASRYKLNSENLNVREVIESAISIAQEARNEFEEEVYIALDLGPIGRMMKPIGDLSFDEAYEYYKEQIICSDGADLILIETISDLNEGRAAVLAAKENSDLPIIISMTFQDDSRSLTGVSPEVFVHTMEGLGVDALGVNCSLGPEELLPIIKLITDISSIPVIVQANAGLPKIVDEITVFDVSKNDFSNYVEKFIELGVRIVGGCCGTGPEHIECIKKNKSIMNKEIKIKGKKNKSIVCSSTTMVNFDSGFKIIGERINPTGNKKLKNSLKEGNLDIAIKEAIDQSNLSSILDVNIGIPDINEVKVMNELIDELVGIIDIPLQIDSSKVKVLESGLRRYPGIGIINSLNGKQKSMDKIFPIAKKYGAMIVCLTLDENGIPSSSVKRVEIAEKIIKEAKKYNISEEKLIIDCLVLTVSAQQSEVIETIDAIRIIKSKYNVKTTLGISNVSYGMPNRKLLTRTFMSLAIAAGLDSAIMDPLDKNLVDTILATNVLINSDIGGEKYIEEISNIVISENLVDSDEDFFSLVLKGDKEKVKNRTIELLKNKSALEIVDNILIPTLDEVGKRYENKSIFLPQLIRGAETIGVAFDIIKVNISKTKENISKGKIIMATVKGDVHDIGKNLVKILLENYGYDIIDLGKDVSKESILSSVKKNNIKLVGLSALMTTTVISMEETIKLLKAEIPGVKIFVGGAVLTEVYAKKINADYYCRDGKDSVNVAKVVFES